MVAFISVPLKCMHVLCHLQGNLLPAVNSSILSAKDYNNYVYNNMHIN